MSRNPVICAYCRQVGKALELPRAHKRHLLDGLERELEERFSSEAGVTLETICRDAGSPEESALALMECIGERERTFYLSRQKLLMRIIVIVLIAVIIGMVTYFSCLVQHSIDYAEVKIIQYDIVENN